MSKWVVDIHGDIEGDYEIIKKYEEPKADVLEKIRAEIEAIYDSIDTVSNNEYENAYEQGREVAFECVMEIIDKYIAESEG